MFKSVLRSDKVSPIWPISQTGNYSKPEREQMKDRRNKQLCQDFIEAYQTAVKADEAASKKATELGQIIKQLEAIDSLPNRSQKVNNMISQAKDLWKKYVK